MGIDALSQLNPFSWRGSQFPVVDTSVSLSMDLVHHKYWGVDGVRLENTGRDGLVIRATIPFRKGVTPAKNEGFVNLYPQGFRDFINLCAADKSLDPGVLGHPEFGEILCRVQTVEQRWSSTKRDGVDVEVTWVETLDDLNRTKFLSSDSPVDPTQDVIDLDSQGQNLKDRVPKLKKRDITLGDTLDGFRGALDQVNMLSRRASGKIDAAVNKVTQIKEACDRAKTALTWSVTKNANRIIDAANVLTGPRKSFGKLLTYVVPGSQSMTLSGLSSSLKTDVATLIKLNPKIVRSPEVKPGTTVYYLG